MKTWFEVPGDPVGYYASGLRPNRTRQQQYHSYKQKVQLYAKMAGVMLPMTASEATPLIVATLAYFSSRVHPDPANVQKGVCDALFYSQIGRGSGDKYTAALCVNPLYDQDNPRTLVVVSDEPKDLLALRWIITKAMAEKPAATR